jgi:hypothetical protein
LKLSCVHSLRGPPCYQAIEHAIDDISRQRL